jgi:hypothetical protein
VLTQGPSPGSTSTAAASSTTTKKSAKKAAKSAKRQAKQQQPLGAASAELRRAADQRRMDLCAMLREWSRLLFHYALAHPEPRGILLQSWCLLDFLNVRPPSCPRGCFALGSGPSACSPLEVGGT